MNDAKAFIDTNIFVYLYSDDKEAEYKRHRAYNALEQYDCQISTQVLNEFSSVCIRKLRISKNEIQNFINQICTYCDLAYLDEDTINQALEIHEKYNFSYYDSLIIASAREMGCQYLLSEDMSNGQVIEGTLTIKNIFV